MEKMFDSQEMNVNPIVQEQDFPHPEGRLQKLMSQYRKENHIPENTEIQDVDPMKNVQVVHEFRTREFEELKQKEQQKVLARIDGINYMVSGDIQTFGSAKDSPVTKQAEIITSKYTASDIGEISDPMTSLVASLKSNNTKAIVKKTSVDLNEGGIFASFRNAFALRDAKKKMFKALAEHDTIKHNIDTVWKELQKQQFSLRKDIEVYESMGSSTYGQISEFEYDCIALDLMIEDAKHKLSKLTTKGTLDLNELNKANQLKSSIDRMQRRKYTIMTVLTSTVQTLPQLAVLIRGNEIICEKIDEIGTLVIPMWSWQYAIAAGAIRQQEALSIQKTIREVTSKLITGNAKMLHDNMIAAQEELYAAAIAIDDLVVVQNYIDDMVTKVNETSKEASKKYVEGMKTMQEIQNKNYALMTKNIGTE